MGGEGWLKREAGAYSISSPQKGAGGILEMGAQIEDLPYMVKNDNFKIN